MILNNLHSLFFQAGTGCVSDCNGCVRQFGIPKKSFDKLIDNINSVVESELFNNNIMIYNIDYFNFTRKEINKILSYNRSFTSISFHVDIANIRQTNLLEGIKLVYQKNFGYLEIKRLLQLLSIEISNSILLSYWCKNFQEVGLLIRILRSKNIKIDNFKKQNNLIEFYIGQNIHLKFFLVDNERYNLESCYFIDSIYATKESVIFTDNFSLGYLEVQLNGDIRVHEPPCGFGDLVISNIKRNKNQIIQDFSNFGKHIDNINETYGSKNQVETCKNCKNNKYTYED